MRCWLLESLISPSASAGLTRIGRESGMDWIRISLSSKATPRRTTGSTYAGLLTPFGIKDISRWGTDRCSSVTGQEASLTLSRLPLFGGRKPACFALGDYLGAAWRGSARNA